jgi:hypothetical protein
VFHENFTVYGKYCFGFCTAQITLAVTYRYTSWIVLKSYYAGGQSASSRVAVQYSTSRASISFLTKSTASDGFIDLHHGYHTYGLVVSNTRTQTTDRRDLQFHLVFDVSDAAGSDPKKGNQTEQQQQKQQKCVVIGLGQPVRNASDAASVSDP